MTGFGEALEALRHGASGISVRRRRWPSARCLVLVSGSHFEIEAHRAVGIAMPEAVGSTAVFRAHIDVVERGPDGTLTAEIWLPTTTDLLALDWEVIRRG